MKIALICQNAKLYSHQRLIKAAEARGHTIDVIRTLNCYMNIASRRPEIYFNGESLTGYDAVIPRIGASVTFYGLAVLRQFKMMGVFPLNESVAIGRSRDKLRSMQLLARDGVDLPVTAFAHDAKQAGEVVKLAGGAPVVIKLLEGTQGIGVVLADTEQSAKSVIEAFRGANVNILAQEFIKESAGTDIRAIVVGGKVVAAMKRTGTHRRRSRIPLEPAPWRICEVNQDFARRTFNRDTCSQIDGACGLRCRNVARQPRCRRHGSKLIPWSGRCRKGHGAGRCRNDHPAP
jgi:ribosomal protein S6--L-glutamate ligase